MAAVTLLLFLLAHKILPSASGVAQIQPDQAPLPGEYIFPAANSDVWNQLKALVRDLEFRAEKTSEADQLLVTRWTPYSDKRFPRVEMLGLAEGTQPRAVQLHLYVSPGRQPARVAVGVILEIRDRADVVRWIYRQPQLTTWFVSRLSERVGAIPEPLEASAEGRAAQSRRLMPAGITEPCPEPARRGSVTDKIRPPRRLSEFNPSYPGGELKDPDAKVAVVGQITEHGTFVIARTANTTQSDAAFADAARAAVALWRYQPATAGDCPMLVPATVVVSFSRR